MLASSRCIAWVAASCILLPLLPRVVGQTQAEGALLERTERSAIWGRVSDKAGKAWAGATVHLVSSRLPWLDRDKVDRLRTTTDASGRFKVQALVNRRYAAWAVQAREDGYRVSETSIAERPGVPIRLVEAAPHARQPLAVEGYGPWKRAVGLRYRLDQLGGRASWTGPFVLDDRGRFELPMLAGDRIYLTVVDATGCVVVPQLKILRGTQSVPDAGSPIVRFLAPKLVQVSVVESSKKVGISGARLVRFDPVRSEWKSLGVTDAQGKFQLAEVGPRAYGQSIVVHARGYREKIFAKAYEGGTLSLDAAKSFEGRILISKGRPAIHAQILLTAVGTSDGSIHGIWERSFRTDREGRFWIPRPGHAKTFGPPFQYALVLVLDRHMVRALSADPLYPYVLLRMAHIEPGQAGIDKDLRVDAVLDKLLRVDVEVLGIDGQPAPFARLAINLPSAGFGNSCGLPVRPRANRRGQLRLLLPRRDLILGARLDHAIGVQALIPGGFEGVQGKFRIRLAPPVLVTGHVLDDEDQPLRGVRVSWELLAVKNHGLRHVVNRLKMGSQKSDEKGQYRMYVPFGGQRYRLNAFRGSLRLRDIVEIKVPESGLEDVDLRIR